MGFVGLVLYGVLAIGVRAGGVWTHVLNCHWIFLVNIPVGVLVYALSVRLLPKTPGIAAGGRVDVAGAIAVTASLMIAVYAIINGNEEGWTSAATLAPLSAAAALFEIGRAHV